MRRLTDRDFEAAERLDQLFGISAIDDERRRELMKVVHALAEADRVVEEVRAAMLGPYGGLLRLALANRRSTRSVARVAALNDRLEAAFVQAAQLPGCEPAATILRGQLRLHLEADAELIASLSPERRAVVEGLR
ncbi:MAG: hypothetical protein NTV23_02370 [Propionibacteriales bacterium]|nr:hypothetical protein [Propionibacteriales bacterium]